ncbi:hypothetical protein D915_005369 [Fasciola hepatica]|uniref:Fibronectin type-III domain-containing protein n=1 Tax=Fasciola hepatica TaxID=6192 RepID=A0A4E0RT75_FASHE|nr:hypothetical protein D915_005369 [Fasciola hepatica]
MNNGVGNKNNSACAPTSRETFSAVCTPTKLDFMPVVGIPKDCETTDSVGKVVLDSDDTQSTVTASITENKCRNITSCDTLSAVTQSVGESLSPVSLSSAQQAHISQQPSVTSTPTRTTAGDASIIIGDAVDMPPNDDSADTAPFVAVPPPLTNGVMSGPFPGQGSANQGEYYVMVHVDAGETFSVRVGDQIQHIPGPATVRMVSNSGPPLPMPMRVPPGHLVQQIVDEEGILTHVILSLYPGPGQTAPPGTAQTGPGGGATLTHSVTQTNSLVTPGLGLLLDPNPHLHPHHHHHHPGPPPSNHHHPSPVSAVGSTTHLGIGIPAIPSFSPHQSIPTPGHPTDPSPPGAPPPPHFSAPFLPTHQPVGPQSHFHAPYPFHHHHHPSMCSAVMKPHPQQTPPVMPAPPPPHPQATMSGPHYPQVGTIAPNDWSVNGVTDPGVAAVPDSVSTATVIKDGQEVGENNADDNDNDDEDVQGDGENTSTRQIKVSKNPTTPVQTNGDHKNRNSEENHNPGLENSHDGSHVPFPSDPGVRNGFNGVSSNQSNSPTKSNTKTQLSSSKLSTNVASTTPLSEVTFNGSAGESTQSQTTTHSGVYSGPTDTLWGPQSASHRRRRTGTGKSNPASRTSTRPGGFSATKPYNSVTAADSSVNGNHPTSLSVTRKPLTTGSRQINAASSTATSSAAAPNVPVVTATTATTAITTSTVGTTISGNSSGTTATTTTNYPGTIGNPANSQIKSPNYSFSRGRGRTQQPYLLSTPSHIPCGNTIDYTASNSTVVHNSSSLVGTNEDSKTLLSPDTVNGGLIRDRTHLVWESEAEREAIQSILSAVPAPQVSDIEAHSALIHLSLPIDLTGPVSFGSTGLNSTDTSTGLPIRTAGRCTPDLGVKGTKIRSDGQSASELYANPDTSWTLDEADIQFELHLAERDLDSRFNCVFVGEATYISLQDLRPGSDYYVKACCVYSGIRGQFSAIVRFTTEPSEPSAPRSLTVIGHTRTTLQVKWSAAADNGSRITAYRLEYARGNPALSRSSHYRDGLTDETTTALHFVEAFHGLAKSYKLTQLTPSTEYLLRVMAENSFGASPWSVVVSASTSGSPPPTPRTPHLVTSGVHSLTLAWSNSSTHLNQQHQQQSSNNLPTTNGAGPTISYTLEMEDEAMGHGFVTVFDGTGTEHCVGNLRRNTRYRFRLAAVNSDGRSRWSEIVTLCTLPNRPTPPLALRLVGPPRSNRVDLVWEAPEDDGGLSVQSYRLEVNLPYIPCSTNGLNSMNADTTFSSPNASVTGVEKLLCWPRATGLPGKTLFCSRPSTGVRADDTSCLFMPKLVQLETRHFDNSTANSSADSVSRDHEVEHEEDLEHGLLDSFTPLTTEDLSKLGYFTDSNSGTYQMGWFIVYEGIGQEVVLDHLVPGSHVLFRVRACSATDSDTHTVLVGPPSTPPFALVLPAVAPDAPDGPIRVVGRPRPHSVCLTWPLPKFSGGAPVLAYEVWQMDSPTTDPPSGDSVDDKVDDSDDADVDLTNESYMDRYNDSRGSSFLPVTSSILAHSRSSSGCSERADDSINTHSTPLLVPSACGRTDLSGLLPMGRLICSVLLPECRVTGLHPGSRYAFRVRACNRIGRGPWTEWAKVTTVPGPPAAPRHAPRVHPSAESGGIRVEWDPVRRGNGAPVSSYILEWQPISSTTPTTTITSAELCDFQLLYSGSSLSYELEMAQPASRFAFRFCARNSAGPGPWSPIATCLTPPARPGQPCGLRASRVETDAIHLLWFCPQPNGSPISSFRIELTRLAKDPSISAPDIQLFDVPSPLRPVAVAPATTTHSSNQFIVAESDAGQAADQLLQQRSQPIDFVLTDLVPDSNYRIRVRASNALGYGTFSSALNVATLPPLPEAPQFTGFAHLTANSVRVQWARPEPPPLPSTVLSSQTSNIATARPSGDDMVTTNSTTMAMTTSHATGRAKQLCYTLQLSQGSDPEWSVIYEGTESSYKATRLQENSSYSFRVCASNVSGPGPYSAVRTITTPCLPPPAVRGLKATEVSVDTCQLEWTPIILTGSVDPIVYVLHLMPVQQNHTNSDPVPSQVYRGCQTTCRVVDLLPNTEYVCRVGAVRLCQPKPRTVISNPSAADSATESSVTDQWQRELVTGLELQISELPGPFSQSLVFTTRNQKDSKLPHDVDVSASHLHHILSVKSNRDATGTRWSYLRPGTILRFLGIQPDLKSPLATVGSNDPFLGGRSSLGLGVSAIQNTQGNAGSSPWRRRIGPVGSTASSQQSPKSPGQVSSSATHTILSQQQPQSQHHHHSGPRRGHSWFRLSERKWACLFLCLFAMATLLVAFSLQHVLTSQPNSSAVTVEEIRSSTNRLRSPHSN